MKGRTVARLLALAAAALLVVTVKVMKSVDAEGYRTAASNWVMRKTGRAVAIDGAVALKLRFRPALAAEDVSLANRAGTANGAMARVGRVEAELAPLPLLSGKVKVDRILLRDADLYLDSDASGHGNWQFAPSSEVSGADSLPDAAVDITRVVVEDARVHWRNAEQPILVVERATFDTDGPSTPIAVTVTGVWEGRHFILDGVLGSFNDALAPDRPLSVQLKALLPGLIAGIAGTIAADADHGDTISLASTVEVNDSATLSGMVGLPIPSLGSARATLTLAGPLLHPRLAGIEATLGRHDALALGIKGSVTDPQSWSGVDLALTADGDLAAATGEGARIGPLPMLVTGHLSIGAMESRSLRLSDLKGTVGRSDIAGNLTISLKSGRPAIEGRFTSALLELTRPPLPPGQAEAPRARDGRVFPDVALPLAALAATDGTLSWKIGHLIDHRLDTGGAGFDLDWHDGQMKAHAEAKELAGGTAEFQVTADSQARPPRLGAEVTISHVLIGELLSSLDLPELIEGGRIDWHLTTSGEGTTLRQVLASQQGASLLTIGSARLAPSLRDGGLGAVLGFLTPAAADRTEMRCLVSHFTLIDGLARAEALLLDLGTVTVTGQGSVNLTDETLDFTLTPRSTSASPTKPSNACEAGCGAPSSRLLDIGGTLLHPAVAQDRAAIVRNLPGASSQGVGPLTSFAAAEAGPCITALTQGRRPPRGEGGLR